MTSQPLTEEMLNSLNGTRPWVRFMAGVGYLFVLLLLALGVLLVLSDEGVLSIGVGVLVLVIAGVFFFLSRSLSLYARTIAALVSAPSKAEAVEKALWSQRSFWKLAGIVSLATLILHIPAILLALGVPVGMHGIQRTKQKRTIADIRTLGAAVEAYYSDNKAYPRAANLDELAKILSPTYIHTMPQQDAWKHRYIYESVGCDTVKCARYYIASVGKDGHLDQLLPSAYGTRPFQSPYCDDTVYSNGELLFAPEH